MTGCLIEAGAILYGANADGDFRMVTDAAIHVAGGTIAAIGPVADMRRAHPELPHHGGPGLVNRQHYSGITP